MLLDAVYCATLSVKTRSVKRQGESTGKRLASPPIPAAPCLRFTMLQVVLLLLAITCVVVAESEGTTGPTRNAAEDIPARGRRQRDGAYSHYRSSPW